MARPTSTGIPTNDRIPHVTLFGPDLFRHHLVGSEAAVPVKHHQFVPLDNDITPVFRFKNWRNQLWPATSTFYIDSSIVRDPFFDYPLDFYERIKPALRLATIWLNRAKPFFVSIYRAPVLERNGKVSLDHTYVPNDFDYALFDQLEHYLTDTMLIYHNDNLTAGTANVILGVTCPIGDLNPARPIEYMAIMGICKELIASIGMSDFYTKPRAERETQLAYLAWLMTHELAHAVWFTRNYEDRHLYPNLGYWTQRPEPAIPPIEFSELGHTLACVLFGCDFCLPWMSSPNAPTLPNFDGKGNLREDFFSHRAYTTLLAWWKVSEVTTHSFFNKLTWTGGRAHPPIPAIVLDIYSLPCGNNENHQPVLHDPRRSIGGTGLLPLSHNPTLSPALTRDEILRQLASP